MEIDPIPHTSDVLSNDKHKLGKISETWHRFLRSLESKINSLAKNVASLTFTGLTDTPASYTGHAGKSIRVTVGENGLEFYTPPTVITDHNDLSNNGTSTHAQLDSERDESITHRSDASIHFTDESVLHNNRPDLQGGAEDDYQHLTSSELTDVQSVPGHIGNDEIHNLEFDELDYSYTANLNTSILIKNNNVLQKTITNTFDGSNRYSTISNGSKTWTLTYDDEGFFTGAIKA